MKPFSRRKLLSVAGMPAYGLYCRHVKGLRLCDVELKGSLQEERPAIFCDDVENLEISGLQCALASNQQPVIELAQSKRVSVQNCIAPPGTNTFLKVRGDQTRQVVLMNNNLVAAETAMLSEKDIPEKSVTAVANAEARS